MSVRQVPAGMVEPATTRREAIIANAPVNTKGNIAEMVRIIFFLNKRENRSNFIYFLNLFLSIGILLLASYIFEIRKFS